MDQVRRLASHRQRPSAAAEDRNTGAVHEPLRPSTAAAAVRGGRGSQLLGGRQVGRGEQSGSGRRPRRPRIATARCTAARTCRSHAAAAVRGGRGSQRLRRTRRRPAPAGQRPPSAAAEDRNWPGDRVEWNPTGEQRPPSAAAEDRNPVPRSRAARAQRSGRRPRRPRITTPTGTTGTSSGSPAAAAVRGGRGSQRKVTSQGTRAREPAAAAVRGGRGSQPVPRRRKRRGEKPAAAAVRGGRGSQHRGHNPKAHRTASSGRRPRRPRIATPCCPTGSRPVTRAAAAVCGGRGSQQPCTSSWLGGVAVRPPAR